jgi:hypothetical protein
MDRSLIDLSLIDLSLINFRWRASKPLRHTTLSCPIWANSADDVYVREKDKMRALTADRSAP